MAAELRRASPPPASVTQRRGVWVTQAGPEELGRFLLTAAQHAIVWTRTGTTHFVITQVLRPFFYRMSSLIDLTESFVGRVLVHPFPPFVVIVGVSRDRR